MLSKEQEDERSVATKLIREPEPANNSYRSLNRITNTSRGVAVINVTRMINFFYAINLLRFFPKDAVFAVGDVFIKSAKCKKYLRLTKKSGTDIAFG